MELDVMVKLIAGITVLTYGFCMMSNSGKWIARVSLLLFLLSGCWLIFLDYGLFNAVCFAIGFILFPVVGSVFVYIVSLVILKRTEKKYGSAGVNLKLDMAGAFKSAVLFY